jgi:hypothetical protein
VDDILCENDGSYGLISCDTAGSCKCIDKMNQAIKEFTAPFTESSKMDCRLIFANGPHYYSMF